MIAKRGALLLGIVVLAFVSVSIIAEMLTGQNVSQIAGSVYSNDGKTTVTPTPANLEKCKCTYDIEFEEYICNNDCGDLSRAVCETTNDCLV